MVGQCPVCKGYFGIQQEWVGQEAQCPHCQQKRKKRTFYRLCY